MCNPQTLNLPVHYAMEPFYSGLRDTLLARIKSGKVTEDTELLSALGALDVAQLTLDVRRSCAALGIEPTVPINSVGDFLGLLKAIDSKREHNDKNFPQTP